MRRGEGLGRRGRDRERLGGHADPAPT